MALGHLSRVFWGPPRAFEYNFRRENNSFAGSFADLAFLDSRIFDRLIELEDVVFGAAIAIENHPTVIFLI